MGYKEDIYNEKLFVLYSKVAELLSFIVDHQQTNIDLQQNKFS